MPTPMGTPMARSLTQGVPLFQFPLFSFVTALHSHARVLTHILRGNAKQPSQVHTASGIPFPAMMDQ